MNPSLSTTCSHPPAVRRQRGRVGEILAQAILMLALILVASPRVFGDDKREVPADATRFSFPRSKYPILYDGDKIGVSEKVNRLDFFAPLFGRERKKVNPSRPIVIDDGSAIRFVTPGEYYVKVNNKTSIKVLVLSKRDPISENVVRVFDFTIANLFFANYPAEQNRFHVDVDAYIDGWFKSRGPGVLLCGETHVLFRKVIRESLALPTRTVTFPGVFLSEGTTYKASHNLPEVYLPDIGKWVLFDINYGFFAQWMDATELATYINRHPALVRDTGYINAKAFLKLDIRKDIATSYWPRSNGDPIEGSFQAGDVSSIPTSYFWKEAFRFYYGGPGYWGGDLDYVKPTGTEFLPGQYLFASLHHNPKLKRTALIWIKTFGIDPEVVSPSRLARLLAAGHAKEIERRAWQEKLSDVAGASRTDEADRVGMSTYKSATSMRSTGADDR